MKRIGISTVLVLCAVCAWAQDTAPPPAPPDGPQAEAKRVRVTVTAEGYDRDDALKQALRKALEQGAGAQIASFSTAENFALLRDTIYSRSAGIVSSYKIVKEGEAAGGLFSVTIDAEVSPSAVVAAWGEVQNVLDQLGRPKILVWIDETIDGAAQAESIVESRLEEMFVKVGFDVIARRGIDDAKRREFEDAARSDNVAKMQAIAKDAHAHIFIRGAANANRAGMEDLYGVPATFYNCDALARVYYTDTGKLLASESLPLTRKGARSRREFSPQAARVALAEAALPDAGGRRTRPGLAQKLFESVMEQWATQISAGGEIELEIEKLDFKTFVKIKKALGELKGVDSVNGEFGKSIGTFRVRAKIAAQTLAERLTDPPFAESIEVLDLKLNRIQARQVGGG